jgi:hypothetical protein
VPYSWTALQRDHTARSVVFDVLRTGNFARDQKGANRISPEGTLPLASSFLMSWMGGGVSRRPCVLRRIQAHCFLMRHAGAYMQCGSDYFHDLQMS